MSESCYEYTDSIASDSFAAGGDDGGGIGIGDGGGIGIGDGGGGGSVCQPDSTDSLESSYKSSRPHRLKLLALSAELMRSPTSKTGKESSVRTVGLLEEARNRRSGRKERCVHWDRIEVKGREFPLQRADTSTAAHTAAATGALGRGRRKSDPIDESDPSYLLVGHTVCDMCLVSFESSSVSGVITMKRIMEARREWGLPGSRSKKYAAASSLYEPARLCVLCSQFFRSKMVASGRGEGELVPCGVGRSTERVSLSLESMASNKPLSDRATTATTKAIVGTAGAADNKNTRCLSISKQGTRGTTVGGASGGGDGVPVAPNFLLDELIADDRLVVNETDLARQIGTRATQSSTADGMGPHVCISFPASTDRRARGHRPIWRPQHAAAAAAAGEGGGPPPRGTPKRGEPDARNPVSRVSSNTNDTRSTALVGSSAGEQLNRPSPKKAPAAAFGPATASSSAPAAAPVPETTLPPRKMRMDEIAAAAAVAVAARTCSRTRRESQPWWEVDLGGAFPVRCVRVHHPDRRTEATKAGASPFVDVAPFWIMTSAGPIGEAAPEEAQGKAIASKRFGSHGKVTTWELGANHFATSVRVQAEGVKSLQLARVEVIKGGGTQQAKDAIQQQSLARKVGPRPPPRSGPDDSSSSQTIPSSSAQAARAKNRPEGEHAMAKKFILQFFLQGRGETVAGLGPSGSTAVAPTAGLPSAAAGVAVSAAAAAAAVPTTAGLPTAGLPTAVAGREGGSGDAGMTGSAAAVAVGSVKPSSLQPASAGGGLEKHRPQTCPALATSSSVGNHSGTGGGDGGGEGSGGGGRCTTSGWPQQQQQQQLRRRRRRRRSPKAGLPGEDVTHLLLRAMVGYDWVDDLNGQEMRVRGAFTKQDVVILEDLFFRCALGDDAEARAAATVSDPLLRLDAGELCGNLRRLQLQVQTNAGGKSKTPILVAVRESPNLFQLLSSGVVETLPDALARAEAQLPPAQRPLCLDWTRFLGVMGLCLEGGCGGVGTVAASAVAHLFEETRDEKLDFLTRKRSRLPPPSGNTQGSSRQQQQQGGFSPPSGGGRGTKGRGVAGRFGLGSTTTTAPSTAGARSDGTAGASAGVDAGGGSLGMWTASSADEGSLREGGGGSVDTGDDTMELSFSAGGTGTRPGTGSGNGAEIGTGQKRGQPTTASHGEAWGGTRGRRRARGGSSAALRSLLRPQARHEVFRGYGEAVSRRRGRQREAFRRAPEPDVEPTRAYKPCGLCQAPFPVDSLRGTVSLKVLGTFLARAGAPSQRFERKASRLCALHRLRLCVFCSQFFDPDFPGGIVPPGGYTAKRGGGVNNGVSPGGGGFTRVDGVDSGASGGGGTGLEDAISGGGACVGSGRYGRGSGSRSRSPVSIVEGNGLVPFFDDKFPDRWSDTPPSSSAPVRGAPAGPGQGFAGTERGDFPSLSAAGNVWQGGSGGGGSGGVSRNGGGGDGGGGGGGVGGEDGAGVGRYLREAVELREVGELVRGGCSIRDRLLPSPV